VNGYSCDSSQTSITPEEFRLLAANSCTAYYKYLQEKEKTEDPFAGCRVIHVRSISPLDIPNEYILCIAEKIKPRDEWRVFIKERPCKDITILAVRQLSQFSYGVRIRDDSPSPPGFDPLKPEDTKLVFDLKFLIQNLGIFYRTNHLDFSPQAPDRIDPLPSFLTQNLSSEQVQAIETIFSSPVSYINGAPGTGKTRAVLANCILRYLLAKQRVILLAPTNNAVEQMLYGVLPVLKDAGIELTNAYRIGSSSEKYATLYPETIGDTAVEDTYNSLKAQEGFVLTELEHATHLYERYCAKEALLSKYHSALSTIIVLSGKLEEAEKNVQLVQDTISHSSSLIQVAASEYDSAVTAKDIAFSKMEACNQVISHNNSTIHSTRSFIFGRKKRNRLIQETKELLLKIESYQAEYECASSQAEECKHQLDLLKAEHQKHLSSLDQINASCTDILHQIYDAANVDSDFYQAFQPTAESSDLRLSISSLQAFIQTHEQEFSSLEIELSPISIPALRERLNILQRDISNVGRNAKLIQLDNALLVAGTIDSMCRYLSALNHQIVKIPPSHVFLDEAGYTSLARGMVAFSCRCPVTFLGDHKQLQPVCEMNQIPVTLSPVCLFALSISYFSELVYGDFESLYRHCYCAMEEPSFSNVSFSSLNTSFRFAPALANILGKYIYTKQFSGTGANFELLIIDAPFSSGPRSRTSQSEAFAIARYLQEFSPEDVSILAPYRNQVQLLQKTLPRKYRDNILTIHRSQGCEWDTVIFSVTDTTAPFFTDSQRQEGCHLLNTAISRTKKRLVIACDVAAWLQHPNQLISELITCGKIISPAP